ncbi:hypothetical protein BDD12DRAFT_840666 [Trichophaea hybrida]|nr:hypothetical protein BDD12DRAFT_840666 [Trichophaea hybrida]
MMVTTEARPGDVVYIHYSGHGAQARTVYPELKGPNSVDEALVPCDIHCGGRYLRDFELAELLDIMVQKGLVVTIVLDSCHSGSASRGPRGEVPRGIGKVDYTVLPSDKSDIPGELLASVKVVTETPILDQGIVGCWKQMATSYLPLADLTKGLMKSRTVIRVEFGMER